MATDLRSWTHLPRVLVAASVLVLAAACGGGSDDAAGKKAFTVVGTEMAFEAPASVAAGSYKVTFRNAGALSHELAFRDPTGEFVMRRSIGGGQSVVLDVTLTAGTWTLECHEPGHYAAGMHRPLEVTPAA